MTPTRIYRVTERGDETGHPNLPGGAYQDIYRLIEAATPAQALRHVVKPRFMVSVPSALEVAELMGKGAKVERAGEEKEA